MTAALDRVRLARVLSYLSSNHDGEVVNAGRIANDMVRAADMSWAEVVGSTGREVSLPAGEDDFAAEARHMLDLGVMLGALSDWEIGFLRSIQHWSGTLTDRQQTVYDRLRDKVLNADGS